MAQARRLASPGRIDRTRPVTFSFNGRHYEGFAGDTLASALLVNGVGLVARSFKYHRPRGIVGAGLDEPNAIVDVIVRGIRLPNLLATEIELTEGLEAFSVNAWPSLSFDIGSINNLLGSFLPAGFYYKTFFLPHWHFYEW
ncbi:MAG: 2Fe-2S iron-sulfur cluster-binding protein, partial [Alphaproteobacteria bacterium]